MGIDFAPAHATFPLSFQSVDPGHPPRLQSPTSLHPSDHAWGSTSLPPTQLFPFLSSPWIRVTLPDYRVRPLCTRTSRQKYKPYFYQEGEWSFHSPVQSGTSAYRLPYFSICG